MPLAIKFSVRDGELPWVPMVAGISHVQDWLSTDERSSDKVSSSGDEHTVKGRGKTNPVIAVEEVEKIKASTCVKTLIQIASTIAGKIRAKLATFRATMNTGHIGNIGPVSIRVPTRI